jgi:gliding motility-associated-like protein
LLCDVTEALPVAQDITFNVSNVDWQIQDFYSPVNFALQETNFSPQLSTICKTGDTTPLNPCEGDSFRGAKAECICPIYIPNAFTPGRSQNLNDKLKIVYTCPFNSAVVRVYNRWGQKIFESADSGMLWDGQYQGKLVPTGAYYCTVSIKGMYKGLFQEFIKSGVVYVVE